MAQYKHNIDVKFSWGDIYNTSELTENPFSKTEYGICSGIGMVWDIFNQKIINS